MNYAGAEVVLITWPWHQNHFWRGVCRAIAFTVHLDDQMLTQTEVSGVDARYRLARDKEKCNPPSTIVVEEQKWPFCDPLSLFCLYLKRRGNPGLSERRGNHRNRQSPSLLPPFPLGEMQIRKRPIKSWNKPSNSTAPIRYCKGPSTNDVNGKGDWPKDDRSKEGCVVSVAT